jgi:hypothetical protein
MSYYCDNFSFARRCDGFLLQMPNLGISCMAELAPRLTMPVKPGANIFVSLSLAQPYWRFAAGSRSGAAKN